jgi:peptidylprolyl isomerase
MRVLKLFVVWFAMLAGAVAAQVPAPAAPPAPDPQNILHLELSTGGDVVILMRPDKAPASVERIRTLARAGFYDGIVFHRVIEGFMAQTGDPKGTGEGGSPLPDLKAEFNDLPHLRGVVSMARTDQPDTANSQFFICFQPTVRLDGKYTVFGRVTSGMQYVDAIKRGDPIEGRVADEPSRIVRAWIEADGRDAARVPLVVPAPAVAPPPATEPAPAPEAPKPNP